jgi:hypothetical protein
MITLEIGKDSSMGGRVAWKEERTSTRRDTSK